MGNISAANQSPLDVLVKPVASTGTYISLDTKCLPDAVEFSTSDKYVISAPQSAARTELYPGRGIYCAGANAVLGGKNGEAELTARMTLNGITRSASKTVTTTDFPIKLLYAEVKTSSSEVDIDKTATVIATGFLSNGEPADMTGGTVVYGTSTPEIITVKEDGTVTPIREGVGTVTATLSLGGELVSATADIKVVDTTPLAEVSLPETGTVGVFRDAKLPLSGMMESRYPASFENAEVKWKVENCSEPECVSVGEDGTVYGHIYGTTAEISATVTLNGTTKTTNKCTVTVVEADMRDVFINFTAQKVSKVRDARLDVDGWEIDASKTTGVSASTEFKGYGFQATTAVNNNVTIKVNVPYEGIYTLVYNGFHMPAGASESEIYVDGSYAGSYSYYYEVGGLQKTGSGPAIRMRSFYLSAGPHELTFRATKAGKSTAYQQLSGIRLAAKSDYPEIKEIRTDSKEYKLIVGDVASAGATLVMSDGTMYRGQKKLDGTADTFSSITYEVTDTNIARVDEAGKITALAAGSTNVVITAVANGKKLTKTVPVTVDGSGIDIAVLDTDRRTFYVSEKISLGIKAQLASGAALSADKMSLVWSSDDTSVVSFNGSEMTANGAGEANIKCTASYYGGTIDVAATVFVENDRFGAVEITAPTFLMRPNGAGTELTARAMTFLGKSVDMTGAEILWDIGDTDIAIIDEHGYVHPVAAGETTVTATVTIDGISVSGEATVSVREGKVSRTYYTDEMVAAARENVKKYDWAKSLRDTAVKNAEKYLDKMEYLYHMIPGEGIPRSTQVGLKGDSYYQYCRYCGVNIGKINTAYAWLSDPLTRPWQLQCPSCKRLFPSNNFESFYELGLDEHGIFNRELALEKHKELFDGKTYGYGYLKNELYDELTVDPFWETQGKTVPITHGWDIDYELENPADVWGVDDGFGYDTGRTYSGGLREVHSYIAYYHQFALWNSRKHNPGAIQTAVETLRDAYIYTGDEKYGRIGAVMMDRIADVYPDMNARELFAGNKTKVNPNGWVYANANGGEARGKIIGSIWETNIVNYATVSYDAFFPMYDDPQVIEFLTQKAIEYNYEDKLVTDENGKKTVTGETLRQNFENNYLVEVFKAVKESNCRGNFGAHQASLAYAAVVLDTAPHTNEMMDWLFTNGTMTINSNTGGNISERIVNQVSRDGQGNESAPGYNRIWVTELSEIANTLGRYDGYKGMDLYGNPKYLGMIKSYAPLTLVRRGLGSIGDSGAYGAYSMLPDDDSVMINAFRWTKDPEIAQHFYMMKGGNFDGIHYDVFTKNPESLGEEMQAVIDKYGEYDYDKSSLLTGYGFAALRAGTLHNGINTGIIRDTQRDFWLYFGGAVSHSNADDLNLGVEAYGMPMTSDLGYPENANDTDRNRAQWQGSTIAHNSVVVNEASSLSTAEPQKPLHFDAKKTRVKVMDVDSSGSYTATDEYRRTVVMVDYDSDVSYGIDFFKILGGNDHIYSFHPMSVEAPEHSDNLTFTEQKTGTYAGEDVEFGPDPYSVGENSSVSNTNVTLKYPEGYTWLFNVKKAENSGAREFWLDYKIEDRNKLSKNGKMDIHLRMTMLNDFAADEVTLAHGMPPRKDEDTQHAEYMLVRRKGANLDTLFTTVIEPYNGKRYIKSIESVPVKVVSGNEGKYDRAKAVRVELCDGRVDYIVYSQNNSVTYNVGDVFEFRGFVGVYTVNADGENIYSYVNDGEKIGSIENLDAAIGGKVTDFTRELELSNFITIETDCEISDASILVDRMINVEHEGVGNSAFMIESAELIDPTHVKLGLGYVTPIDSYVDYMDMELGYKYDVAEGASFKIAMSYEDNNAPVFDRTFDNLTASAGSSISVNATATAANGGKVTYKARTLPRGASLNSETGKFTWRPDGSQVGENLVAVDAVDEDGRISTQYFTITVYGSTTGGSVADKADESDKTEAPSTGNSDSSAAGGGGGGGGGAAPTDKPETGENRNNNDGESGEAGGNTDNAGTEDGALRFTDLASHAWAEDAINELAGAGIIKGTSASTFSPAANITRADFALLLVRAFDLKSDNTENFADVDVSDYFAQELAIARNTGIVGGIGDNKYAPRDNITRQDMMVIVYRALQKLGVELGENTEPKYPDYDAVATYARDAVSALIGAGLVNGKNNLIAPLDYTTRAEVAVLIKRIMDYTK
ncbi:MAG: S-layer homology domain-containing protein [Oscillospiraceae bacterium]|nr:S-layer homology domain-containing protein [Oscillospiraceae bacterium]